MGGNHEPQSAVHSERLTLSGAKWQGVEEPAFCLAPPKTLRSLKGMGCHPEPQAKDPRLFFALVCSPASVWLRQREQSALLQIISPSRRTIEDSHEYASPSNLDRLGSKSSSMPSFSHAFGKKSV